MRVSELGSVPEIICAECGADWSDEACDTGCANDLDTITKDDEDLPVSWIMPLAPLGSRWWALEVAA